MRRDRRRRSGCTSGRPPCSSTARPPEVRAALAVHGADAAGAHQPVRRGHAAAAGRRCASAPRPSDPSCSPSHSPTRDAARRSPVRSPRGGGRPGGARSRLRTGAATSRWPASTPTSSRCCTSATTGPRSPSRPDGPRFCAERGLVQFTVLLDLQEHVLAMRAGELDAAERGLRDLAGRARATEPSPRRWTPGWAACWPAAVIRPRRTGCGRHGRRPAGSAIPSRCCTRASRSWSGRGSPRPRAAVREVADTLSPRLADGGLAPRCGRRRAPSSRGGLARAGLSDELSDGGAPAPCRTIPTSGPWTWGSRPTRTRWCGAGRSWTRSARMPRPRWCGTGCANAASPACRAAGHSARRRGTGSG